MKLNDQLNQIMQSALLILSNKIKENGGVVTIFEGDRVVDNELTDNFLNSVPEIYHYINDFEGNTIMYPYLINEREYTTILYCIDEQGTEQEVNLFELDANNITLLADCITEG